MDDKDFGTLSCIGVEKTNEFGERYFSNLNFNSFYNVSAYDLYDRDFTDIFKKNSLYLIVGTDSGLLPQYIKQKGLPEGSRYIFIEPEPILAELISAKALNSSEPNFAFANEANWVELTEVFDASSYFYIGAVHVRTAYCTEESSLNNYMELCWFVADKVKQLTYEHAIYLGAEEFIIQQLLNLGDNRCPAVLLRDAFEGKTAFVLGGGPSLDDALPWLLEHRSKVIILAVSRISKRLLDVGIEPDFILCVDPYPNSFAVSKEFFKFGTKPIFIHSGYVHHPLVSQWHGRSLYLDTRTHWKSSLNKKNLNAQPPTVSNAAITVAIQLGFAQIFLAGVDLCYTTDGFTHAKGSNEYAAGARFNFTSAEVTTYAETKAPTGLDYLLARDLLAGQVKEIKKSKLFNISLHAAKVENINYLALSEIVLNNETIDAESIVAPLLLKNNNPDYYSEVEKEIKRSSYQLNEIHKIAQQALKYNNELYDSNGTIKNFKVKQKLDKLEKLIEYKFHDFSVLVKTFGLKNFFKFTKPIEKNSVSTIEERIELAQDLKHRLDIYYNCYIEGTQSLNKILDKSLKIVLARAEEKKDLPNWDLIINTCRDEAAYGRVYLWEQLESVKQINYLGKYQAIFAEFKDKFKQNIESLQVGHVHHVKKMASLSIIQHRVGHLFKYKKTEALINILLTLEKHQEPEKATPYRFLIQGYLAEIEGRDEEALQFYQKVLEEGAGPLKEALLRILHIDYQEETNKGLGHLALECLAQLDPRYLVIYAESNQLRGNMKEAINNYLNYLAIFAEDWQSSLKLANLFYQQKIYEGADIIVKQVLAKHPEQKSALLLKRKLDEAQKNH